MSIKTNCDRYNNIFRYDFCNKHVKNNNTCPNEFCDDYDMLKTLFHNFIDAILILNNDYDRSIINCNRRALSTFGYKKDELIGKPIGILHVNDESLVSFQKMLYSEMEKVGFFHLDKYVMKRKDGSLFVSSHNIIPFFNKRKKQKGLISVVKDLSEQLDAEAKFIKSNNNLKRLAARLQNQSESERELLAKDYFETLGQTLTGLLYKIFDIEKKLSVDNDAEIFKLREVTESIKKLIDTGRVISTRLRPSIIDDLGIAAAIKWMSEEFQRKTGIICNFSEIEDTFVISQDSSIKIFRICQEIFSNIEEHSEATKVDIILNKKDGFLVLKIIDNGIGIDKSIIDDNSSLGIFTMKVLINSLHGKLKIIGDKKKHSTTILLIIPN